MTLEEKETWIEQHVTAADVAVADALSETPENLEIPEDPSEGPEQGFASHSR